MLMKNDSLGVGYNVRMATENQVIVGFGVEKNYEYMACRGMKSAIPPHTFDYDILARHKSTYKSS